MPTAVTAIPKNTENITNCNISLLAIDSTTLFGKTCSTNLAMENSVLLVIRSFTPSVSLIARFIPTPGCVIFTSNKPSNKLINEAEINHNMALPPTLPTVLRSPNLAIPTTKVANTNGAMIICTRRRKMVASNLILGLKSLIKDGDAFSLIRYPTMIPSSIARMIYNVRWLFLVGCSATSMIKQLDTQYNI